MKHLTKGLMAMFLGITAISCVSNTDYGEVDKSEDYKKNAEKKLGITIPANQDFTMVSTATVATTVNLEEGETYTVRVYANDPIQEGVGKYIATGSVQNGHTFTTNVTYPSAKKTLYVGATDSKGFTTYKQVEIVNAQAIANITTKNTTAASSPPRTLQPHHVAQEASLLEKTLTTSSLQQLMSLPIFLQPFLVMPLRYLNCSTSIKERHGVRPLCGISMPFMQMSSRKALT